MTITRFPRPFMILAVIAISALAILLSSPVTAQVQDLPTEDENQEESDDDIDDTDEDVGDTYDDIDDTDEDVDDTDGGDTPSAAQRFADVDEDDYFAEAVDWMLANEITTGCEPDRFCPHDTATRAHFVTFLWRAAGRPEPTVSGAERFDDVDESAYYQQAVGWAAETGVTTGCGDGMIFCPNQDVTRGQIAALLYRFSGQQHTVTKATFQDIPPNAYYFTAVDWMSANAITTGCSTDRFCPIQQAIRAQVAAFLHRYFT